MRAGYYRPVLSASAGGDICISQHKIIDFYINNLFAPCHSSHPKPEKKENNSLAERLIT